MCGYIQFSGLQSHLWADFLAEAACAHVPLSLTRGWLLKSIPEHRAKQRAMLRHCGAKGEHRLATDGATGNTGFVTNLQGPAGWGGVGMGQARAGEQLTEVCYRW